MKKRKAYRPKPVNPMAHIVAAKGAFYLSKPDQLKQAMSLAAAVANISKTGGLKEDWMIVFDVINMSQVTNDEARLMTGGNDFIEGCMDMVTDVMERRKSGVLSLRASELQMLRDLQSLWADLLSTMTYSDWNRITKRTAVRVAHAVVHRTATVVEAA